MSHRTYSRPWGDPKEDKQLVILSTEIKTPPVSLEARREIGFLIRKLQLGLKLEMPHSRAMPTIGRRSDLADPLPDRPGRDSLRYVIIQAKRLLAEYDAD